MSQLNKVDLLALMNLKLPDNTEQDITPEDIRDVLTSMIESDQNANDIGTEAFSTSDLDALTNTVAALLLLTNFPAYAELFMSADGGQVLPLAGAPLDFDSQGAVKVLEYTGNDSEIKMISSVGPTEFNLVFEGTITIDNATSVVFWARVNGINVRQLGTLMPSNNAVDGFSLGAFMLLDDGDLVEIFAIPSADNKLADMKTGARFTITRI